MSSRSGHWRESYDYRSEYFKKNPGLLGIIFICSQCGKPLWGRNSVEVDHIIPPSKYSKKRRNRQGKVMENTSVLARCLNSSFNTVAICPQCNRHKSDRTGLVTVKGAVAKSGELVTGTVQKGISGLVFAASRLLWGAAKVVSWPLTGPTPLLVKITYIVAIVFIVLIVWR